MFSRRTGWDLRANRLHEALAARRRAGGEILDLTISNPTRAGIPYPEEEIAEAYETLHLYDPDPKGDIRAREAIASLYGERGLRVDPEQIVLTSSTSEAYGWLFKLLCNPGDGVLVPRPSYPLFEFLASLESVHAESYPLHYDSRWELDREALQGLLDDPRDRSARAIVVVNPNNPTGSFLSKADLEHLAASACRRGVPLISDEVFSSYPLEATFERAAAEGRTFISGSSFHSDMTQELVPSLLAFDDTTAFVLDGLSKSAGLPGLKAAWIVVSGPPAFREGALARLEMIADTYLSVGAPVQRALPRLIELGKAVASEIRRRTATNLAVLREMTRPPSSCETLRVEGGWSAVIRVPRTRWEEDLCVSLLNEDGVLVQPGWFFDFDQEAFLVVSLLAPESVFREGTTRVLARSRQ